MATVEVGIRQLKLQLSRYLDSVGKGETITVTDRGKPVARIVPIRSTELSPELKRLVEAGLLIDKGPFTYVPRPIRMFPGDEGKTSTDYLREQRR